MPHRRKYKLPPDIQAELDACRHTRCDRPHDPRCGGASVSGSQTAAVEPLPAVVAAGGSTRGEPGGPLNEAAASGVSAFRRRLAMKGPSPSQVEFMSGLITDAHQHAPEDSSAIDIQAGMAAMRRRVLGSDALPAVNDTNGAAGTGLIYATAKAKIMSERATKSGRLSASDPSPNLNGAGTTLIYAAAKHTVLGNRAANKHREQRGGKCLPSNMLRYVHGCNVVDKEPGAVGLVEEEAADMSAGEPMQRYPGRPQHHSSSHMGIGRLPGLSSDGSHSEARSDIPDGRRGCSKHDSNTEVLSSLYAAASVAKHVAKLKVIRQQVRPTQWALGSLMQMEHANQKRKILDRILCDDASKDSLLSHWLTQDLGDVVLPSRAGGQPVHLAHLKVLRDMFEQLDAGGTGMLDYEVLQLEAEAPRVHRAWEPLRKQLAGLLREQQNSSAYLPSRSRKGPLKDPAFRKRMSSRLFNFQDLLRATFPTLPEDEIHQLEQTSKWISARAAGAARRHHSRAGTPPEPKRNAAAIFSLLDAQREGSISMERLQGFLREVMPFPTELVLKSFFYATLARMQEENSCSREEFVMWYMSLWRHTQRPACGSQLDDFFRCDPVGKLNAYLAAERKRIQKKTGFDQQENAEWRAERREAQRLGAPQLARVPTRKLGVSI